MQTTFRKYVRNELRESPFFIGAWYGHLIILITAFLFGLGIGVEEKEKCSTPKAHNVLEILAIPAYYYYRLGCEVVEPRFNLGGKQS